MKLPQPKAELIVSGLNQSSFAITTTSADADAWVRAHAPRFGRLLLLTSNFILYVSPAYDVSEVAQFIASYNTDKSQRSAQSEVGQKEWKPA